MDPKASAKSKRSHSQHGRRSHPTPSAPGSHKNKKPTQAKESEQGGDQKPKPKPQPQRPRPPSLPSNWDRYEDENELEGEQRELPGTAESATKFEGVEDTVAVKSKGADFRYLIEQARSQPQDEWLGNAASIESSTSTVDVTEYFGGLGSMLLARGKGLFSACEDDNFLVDDTVTSSLEIPFLSLDLNALEAQLAKLKPYERLFIEPEYFYDEVETDTVANVDETGHKSLLIPMGSGAREGSSETSDDFARRSQANPACSSTERERTSITISKNDKISSSDTLGKMSPFESHQGSAVTKQPSSSDAAAAKVELDSILDSFGEIEISSSSGFASQLGGSILAESSGPHLIKSTNSDLLPKSNNLSFVNHATKAFDVDDIIDDLISESRHFGPSYNIETEKDVGLSTETFANAEGFSASRFHGTASLDDSIDDLLAETSSSNAQKGSFLSREGTRGSVKEVGISSLPDTLSKALDDLDSLLDL